jgi:hypothetical protein
MLPARFETIPSRLSAQALANTTAPSAARASLNRSLSAPSTHQRLAPLLQHALAQIVAFEAKKVEGDERGLQSSVLGQERIGNRSVHQRGIRVPRHRSVPRPQAGRAPLGHLLRADP